MPSLGRSLSRNRTKTIDCGRPFEYNANLFSQLKVGVNTEIGELIIHSENRRNRRNPFPDKSFQNRCSRYNIRSNSALSKHTLQKTMIASLSPPALWSQTSSFTVNYLNPDFKTETGHRAVGLRSRPAQNDLQIPLEYKLDKRREISEYMKQLKGKDEISEGQLSAIKQEKDDYEEVVTQIALCYTHRLIERSSCVADRDWSGSYLPTVGEDIRLLYVGGYGAIDGVTECRNVNMAAKKYWHIGFENDEAMYALSHMYSLHHLLDGLSDDKLDPKILTFTVAPSFGGSNDSDSSGFTIL